MIAHVMVVLSTDEAAALAAVCQRIKMYAQFSAYAKMFAQAGWVSVAGSSEEELNTLAQTLMISGNQTTVRSRVEALLESGLDELLLQLVSIADEAHEREELLQVVGSLPITIA